MVAEMSCNHNQDFDHAVRIIEAAKDSGADAIKLQTYTADTLTIESDNECFKITGGTLWDDVSLHSLYSKAYMPWEWQPKLKKIANDLGLDLFSSPFDETAVDFLESMHVPAYKVASFEIVDIPLIEKIARTGKPLIISTGMANLSEIEDAVTAARNAGANEIALLKCTSAYPAPPDDMNLKAIPFLAEKFAVLSGLSDHTLGIEVPIAAVAIGAAIIEKHFTISRSDGGPDSAFSLEPHEFKLMVAAIRTIEKALGSETLGPTVSEEKMKVFRRSLFVVKNMQAGESFDSTNVRSIRPGYGLPPKFLKSVLGKKAGRDIKAGTPLSWDLIRDR